MTTATVKTERRDRIESLVKSGQLVLREYQSYERLEGGKGEWGYVGTVENGGSGSYGDFNHERDLTDFDEILAADDGDDLYVFSKYTGYSDYSGSSVEQANCRDLMEGYDGVAISVHGGYSTTDVCFSLRWILTDDDDSAVESLLDIYEGLEDYPLINDETLSTVEMESADEMWDCWAYSDFVKETESALGIELDGHNKDSMRTVFEDCRERANEYWESDGADVFIRVERVVAVVTLDDVKEWIVPVVLAVRDEHGVPVVVVTITGDDWTSNMSLYDDVAERAVETYRDDCTDFAMGEGGAQYSVSVE